MAEEQNRNNPPKPNKFYGWLLSEISDWQDEKLIEQSQAEALRRRYALLESSASGGSPAQSKLIRILSILGVLLIGAGIITFFAANWQDMSNPSKLSVIFISLIASYGLGYYWRYHKGTYPAIGAALILLGSIIFGAGILLISQIYHLGGKLPDAIMFWGIGVLLTAWVTGLTPVLSLSSILFTVWSVLYIDDFHQPAYLYLLFMAAVFLLTYKSESITTLAVNLIGLGIWLGTFLAARPEHTGYISSGQLWQILYFLLAILIYVAGYLNHFSGRFIRFSYWYRLLGILAMIIIFYAVSFKGVTGGLAYDLSQAKLKTLPHIMWGFTALSVLGAAATMGNILLRPVKKKSFPYEMMFLIFLLFFIFFISMFPFQMPAEASRWSASSLPAISYYTIIFNILFFAMIIGTILMGYLNAEVSIVYIGLAAFTLNLITRYCEYAWGLMDRSLFFIGGGLILLVGGFYLERFRRRLLQKIKEHENTL